MVGGSLFLKINSSRFLTKVKSKNVLNVYFIFFYCCIFIKWLFKFIIKIEYVKLFFIIFSCYKLLEIKIYVTSLQNLTLTLNSKPNLNPTLRIMGA
jgi:hypothetical protein